MNVGGTRDDTCCGARWRFEAQEPNSAGTSRLHRSPGPLHLARNRVAQRAEPRALHATLQHPRACDRTLNRAMRTTDAAAIALVQPTEKMATLTVRPAAAPAPSSWDETIVPTLRKRMYILLLCV